MKSTAQEPLDAPLPVVRKPGNRTEWSIDPGDTGAISGVRRDVMNTLRQNAVRDADLWSAEIIIAELLSNAVTHTSGPAFISLCWEGDHPLLSVWDAGPGPAILPPLPAVLPDDDLADGGRGLFLVTTLALTVTVSAHGCGGSQVSVVLDIARSAGAARRRGRR
jgi:anti-sigma regulatory factor (Ser/Thr protein kinase)